MVTAVSIGNSILLREARMNFKLRLGINIYQAAEAAGLRAGKILADDAARREIDGKFARRPDRRSPAIR